MDERQAWNDWNSQSNREHGIGQVQREQAETIERWFESLETGRRLNILEVGCGTGWMVERLSHYGAVTGIDLADEVLDRARRRLAGRGDIQFVAGDFMSFPLETSGPFDVVVTIETMAHFEDQEAFLHRAASLLAPAGTLMIAAQNRPMMERNLKHLPNRGWYRRWVDHAELRELVSRDFEVAEVRSICPKFFDGPLHLLNSERFENTMQRVGLRRPLKWVKSWEERRYWGFTLMCLAQKGAED